MERVKQRLALRYRKRSSWVKEQVKIKDIEVTKYGGGQYTQQEDKTTGGLSFLDWYTFCNKKKMTENRKMRQRSLKVRYDRE